MACGLWLVACGLWRWSLNAKSEASNNVYDKFWNQLLLNLIARSSAKPTDQMSLTVSSANVKRGEKVHFTLNPKPGAPLSETPRLMLSVNESEATTLPLNQETPMLRESLVRSDQNGRFRGTVDAAGD